MRNASKIATSRMRLSSILLLVFLLLLTLAASLFIVKMGFPRALFFIAGIFGLAVAVFMIVYPVFGFYLTIGCSFFVFTLLRLFNTSAPLVTAIDGMVWLTFLGVLVNKAIQKESFWTHCRGPIMGMYLVIILYNIIEFFNPNGGNPELYFLVMRRFLTLMLFLYCALQLFTDIGQVNRFFKVWLILAMVSALYACYEEWIGLPRFELAYIQADPLRERLAALDGGNYRKSSFLPGCTDFGLLMSGSLIIVLTLYLKLKTSSRRKRLFLFSAIIMTLAMTYSGTRTATLMLVIEIALYVLMTFRDRKTLLFASVFAFLFSVVIFGPSYGNGTLRRLKSTFEFSSEESLQVRDINRHNIQPYIYAHPLGGGIGTTGVAFYQYNIGHPLAGFPTDSGLLNIVLETGWVGLLIQCLTYFIILQQGVSGYFKSRDPYYKVLLLSATISIFGYVFAQYAQIAIGQIPSGFLFLALNAIIIRLRQMEGHQLIPESNKN
jgi:putative inorganic carbon (hco3(-)) transporter